MIDLAYWRWGTGRPRPSYAAFTPTELEHLRFVRWLVETGRLTP